jgi:carbonic anhydrase
MEIFADTTPRGERAPMAGITNKVSSSRALTMLKAGNKRFAADKPVYERHDQSRRKELKDGQAPFAIILSCADSRVIPELVFDTGIGELFVIRVAGNIANTSTIASIEYAVSAIKTKLIVVLGHESCGAVGAALGGGDAGHNLNHLLAHLTPALNSSPKSRSVNTVVKRNAKLTAEALEERSPTIASASGVSIRPAFYNLVSGKVDWL